MGTLPIPMLLQDDSPLAKRYPVPPMLAAPTPWSEAAPQIPLAASLPVPGISQASAPTLPMPTRAYVPPSQTQIDLDRRNALQNSGDGISQIKNPLLRGLARAGNVAEEIAGGVVPGLFGRLAQFTPGTAEHHNMLVDNAQARVNFDQDQAQKEAAIENIKAQTENRNSQAEKYDAQAQDFTPFTMSREQAEAINQPQLAGTMTTMRDYNRALTSAGNNNTSDTNNQRNNATKQSISDDKLEAQARLAANKPEQRDDHYIAILAKPAAERTPADLAYKQAYEGYINTKMTQPGIARAVAGASARPVQVVLPGGQAGYMTAGNAIRSGATSLGDNDYKAAGAAIKDFTSGTDAHTLTAFNTAKGHLLQLQQAGDALHNGDVKVLNQLANRYGAETGSSAPAVFQSVKTAVSGEVAKAFTGAGATVSESEEIRKAINDANSPEQLHAVVESYSHLLDTKSGVLQDQLSAARRGRANFVGGDVSAPSRTNTPAPKVGKPNDPLGIF